MMAQKNLQRAIAHYQKAIALQPKQPVWFYVGWGDALNQNGQIEEAIAAYQKAIALNPNSIPALSKLAELYRNQQEYEKAFTYYLKIISLQPKKLFFFQNLVRMSREYAQILLKQNELDRAIATYQEFLNQKKPQNVKIESKLDSIYDVLGRVIIKLLTFFALIIRD